MVPSNVLQRYKAVSGCIIANYQHQVEVFRNFSENNSLKRRLRKEAVRSTLNYLSEDLMDIRENIKKMVRLWFCFGVGTNFFLELEFTIR